MDNPLKPGNHGELSGRRKTRPRKEVYPAARIEAVSIFSPKVFALDPINFTVMAMNSDSLWQGFVLPHFGLLRVPGFCTMIHGRLRDSEASRNCFEDWVLLVVDHSVSQCGMCCTLVPIC
jgi:hypothetical protein